MENMTEVISLIAGLIILLAGISDFFFTTLSGSGAGFISKPVASASNQLVQKLSKIGGRKVFDFAGLTVNLVVLSVWILLLWFGLFLVFSYDPDSIVNSTDRPANWVERLYFTGYILSTLGLGNFQPVSGFFEILTSLFSFFGFIFFTSSMTYLISVSSAVTNKRLITRTINSLGQNPKEIVLKLQSLERSYYMQQLLSLQELVDRHIVNHQAYPVVHFFSNSRKEDCLSLNLARIDEGISLLLNEAEDKEEIKLMRSSITNLLQHIDQNYGNTMSKTYEVESYPSMPGELSKKSKDLEERRAILGGMLVSEGFHWRDV